MTEEYADYLPEGVARGTSREYLPPEPGTGIDYVGPPHVDGVWKVSWLTFRTSRTGYLGNYRCCV